MYLKYFFYFFIILVAIMGNALEVNAQEKTSVKSETASKGESAQPIRTQTLNFEDELVEGGTQKPELFYLLQRKNFNYKKLIKLRENFLPEMRESSELVKTSGSRN